MTLDDKRKVIEVLLCGSDIRASCVSTVGLFDLDLTWEISTAAVDLRKAAAANDWSLSYEESSVEAGYRLIESSPTLRREWFGR